MKSYFILILFFLIGLAYAVISCREVQKKSKINHQDTLALMSLSLNGENFKELFKELNLQNPAIYIALDSTKSNWPKQAGNFQIKLITGFNKQPGVFQRAEEKRFVIDPPILVFAGDTATISIYSYKFHLVEEIKFARKSDQWIIIKENERQF